MSAESRPTTVDLTGRERQVLALIAAGRTNGEIAVELGIAFPTAKTHVSSILSKLGVDTREDAAALWRSGILDSAPSRGRGRLLAFGPLTLRIAAAATGVAVAVAFGILVLAALLARGGSEPAAPDRTAEPSATSTAPVPSPSPTVGVDAFSIVETSGTWARETFQAGTLIEGPGMYFMGADGRIERWRASGDDGSYAYFPSRDDAVVFAQGGNPSRFYVLDRASGREWIWDYGDPWLLGQVGDELVLERGPVWSAGSLSYDGDLLLFDPATGSVRRIHALAGIERSFVASATGDRFAVVTRPADGGLPRLDAMSVADGRVLWSWTPGAAVADALGVSIEELVADFGPSSEARISLLGGRVYDGVDPGPTVQLSIRRAYQQPSVIWSLSWDGAFRSWRFQEPGAISPASDVSPDGTLALSVQSWRTEPPCGEGCVVWFTTTVLDVATGEELFRVNGAGTSTRSLPGTRWLADSSGFVVFTAGDPGNPGADGQPLNFGYHVVARDGKGSRWLPFSSDRRQSFPVPSPGDLGIYALDHYAIASETTGAAIATTNYTSPVSDSFGPWGTGGNELRFASQSGGHGDRVEMAIPDLRIDFPPFDDSFEFAVSRTGTCLNVRTEPVDGAVVGCFPDSTRLELAPGPTVNNPEAAGAWADYRSFDRWVRVSSAAGLEGWVSADYLAWAD